MSRTERKAQTRQRMLEAAGRGFRKGGFGGVGVDGLAKEAGATSGAFYVHFDSKAAAFRASVVQGMADLKEGVLQCQAVHGPSWWPEFVRFYLTVRRTCDLAESCALQTLTPEVARADSDARVAFEACLRDVATVITTGPASPGAPAMVDAACVALATLVGAVTLARAVSDPVVSESIAAATLRVLLPPEPVLQEHPA